MPIFDPMGVTRRAMLVGLAGMGFAAALPLPAFATATERAQALVTQLSAELTSLVNSGRGNEQIYNEFERILARYADMPAVAASVLGPPWRSATPAQQQAFVAAFQHYLSRRYGQYFRDYTNAEIRVSGARDAGNAGVLVNTLVVIPGQENVGIDWQISERGGSTKVVNLVVEGVSILSTGRAEVAAMLESHRGDIDALTAQMRAQRAS